MCTLQSTRQGNLVKNGKSQSLATAILIGHHMHDSVGFQHRVMNGFYEKLRTSECVPGSPPPEWVSNKLLIMWSGTVSRFASFDTDRYLVLVHIYEI